MSEWQPISTAPKDGTQIWLFQRDFEPQQFVGSFAYTELDKNHPDYWQGWVWTDEVLINHCADNPDPTHWQPLPAPPKDDT